MPPIKCWLYKHEGLNLDPHSHRKQDAVVCLLQPSYGDIGERVLQARGCLESQRPATLATVATRGTVSNKEEGKD